MAGNLTDLADHLGFDWYVSCLYHTVALISDWTAGQTSCSHASKTPPRPPLSPLDVRLGRLLSRL